MPSGSPSIALVANPGSGSGAAGRLEQELRGEGAEVRSFPIDRVEAAARCGAERLVIAGGDGSIAPGASEAGRAGIPVAVIPVGTANDFATAAGLPQDVGKACRLAVRGRNLRPVDLAWLGERPFVNVASAGLPPQAARHAEGMKGRMGSLAYLIGAVMAAARSSPVPSRVECDGRPLFHGSAWQVTIGCSGAFGAGSSVGGEIDDGMLRVVAVRAGPRLGLLRRAHGMRRGDIGAQDDVAAASCRRADLDLPPGTELNVDGELVAAGPVSARVEPAAFELVVG